MLKAHPEDQKLEPEIRRYLPHLWGFPAREQEKLDLSDFLVWVGGLVKGMLAWKNFVEFQMNSIGDKIQLT